MPLTPGEDDKRPVAAAKVRLFYKHRGFIAPEQTDGSGNEEREPDILYRWQRPAC